MIVCAWTDPTTVPCTVPETSTFVLSTTTVPPASARGALSSRACLWALTRIWRRTPLSPSRLRFVRFGLLTASAASIAASNCDCSSPNAHCFSMIAVESSSRFGAGRRAIYGRHPTAADVTEHAIEAFAFGMQPEQAQAKAPEHRFGRSLDAAPTLERRHPTWTGRTTPAPHRRPSPCPLSGRSWVTRGPRRRRTRRRPSAFHAGPAAAPQPSHSGACDASTRRRTAVPTGGRDPRGPP